VSRPGGRLTGGSTSCSIPALPPLDLMRRYSDAAQRGDWDAGFAYFAEDIVLHVPGRSALAGKHHGREAAVRYINAALERSHGADVDVELIDMLASDERVALIVRERFHREDGVLEDGVVEIVRANVYRIRGDEIVEVWIFEGDQYAVDELFADPAD
jgi:ketosteroid isomerase-like protein